MDQNTKRDRAQKMKRDKRSKDIKRGVDHPSKVDTKPACVIAPQVVLTNARKNDAASELTPCSKETAEETVDVNQFANLKRETDEIHAINKSFSKRQITSNWSKYETPLPPEDDESVSKGADFESLLGAPISEGGHFKFKSEQMWAPNPLQYSDIFSLDVKHLSRSLSCIPFYEQVSLPKHLFSQEELQQMDNEAKQNSERLKTSPEGLLIDSFYNILKSSLADSPPKEAIERKVDAKIENVEEPSREGGRIEDLYAADRMCTEGSQRVEDVKHVTSTPTVEEIKPNPTREDGQGELSNEENIVHPVPTVSLPQRPNKSKTKGTVKNIQLSQDTAGPEKIALNESLCDSKDSRVSDKCDDDDELDFLLTLKTPVTGPKYSGDGPRLTEPVAEPGVEDILGGVLGALSLSGSAEKNEDLEDWLDSMLDD